MQDLSPLGQAALDYAARGWHIFPLIPGSKDPLISKRMGGRGFWDATTDLERIRRWWTVTPDANIGLGLVQSGLVCIDADTYKPDCQWASFIAGHDLPGTLIQRSASGGTHYIFRAPKSAEFPGQLCLQVDVKHKGYILLEPSSFNGQAYQWQTDDDPADAPDWLMRAVPAPRAETIVPAARLDLDPRIRAYCDRAISDELAMVRSAVPGTRNNTLNAAAFAIGQIVEAGYADMGDMESALMQATADWDNPEKTHGTILSGLKGGMATPRHFPMEDEPPFDPAAAEAMAEAMWQAFERKDRDAFNALAEESRRAAVAAALTETPPSETSARSASRFADRALARDKPKPIEPISVQEFWDAFPKDVPPFPVQDFETDLSGLLRELTQHIDESANMRSEQGAFGAALAALGAIMGRKVEIRETGLRTNLYVIGTAHSGAGKSSAMNAMTAIFPKCGIDDRLAGSDFTSGSAILAELGAGHVPRLFCIDEFGDVLRRALSPRAAPHERDIGRILKDMYSSAAGIYRGKSYSLQPRKDILQPHLCIYGVSTHEVFWQGINGESFNDGLLARFVIIPIGATETQTPHHDKLKMVSDMITDVVQAGHAKGNLAGAVDNPTAITFAPGIWDQWVSDRKLFQRHGARAELLNLPGAPSIIQRICENAMKIAMISATGRQPVAPTITQDDYDLGLDVAHWSAIYMIASIDRYYVENASHRDLNRVLEYIEAAGASGRSKSELYRTFQGIFVNSLSGKNIIEALKEADKIMEWAPHAAGPGRRATWFVTSKSAAEFIASRKETP